MTIWQPDLTHWTGPRYRAIADALTADVREGRLRPGDRLPTHRDLAWRLGVTVGTVSRAYDEAQRRGLIAGEVGRGTFIRSPPFASNDPVPRAAAGPTTTDLTTSTREVINFSNNYPVPGAEAELLGGILRDIAAEADLGELLRYQPHGGRPADKEAGALWLRRAGIEADPDRLLITGGGQHALTTVLAAIVNPGETAAAEALTYPGVRAACHLHHVRLEGIAMDEIGILPDAFAAACRATPLRMLYLTPNLHNPTAGVLPLDRRNAIVEIARAHDVTIVEDDVYGFLIDAPPAFTTLAPERSIYITSLSKSTAPGLRVGYVLAPRDRYDRLAAAIRSTIWMAAPLMVEIATRWLRDGTIAQLATTKRAEATRRQTLARQILGNRFVSQPSAYHLWLPMPEAWRAEDFAAEARRRGVGVTASSAFAVMRHGIPQGVRLCLGAPAEAATVERGLRLIADLLREQPDPCLSVV
ncbi:MAG TPA: PLP-dependent aminotransferase family protein [Stellaceae bacterium]|nr:PLP-dependent aminotransferase family protein [Stellaceae bacterium]